MKIFSFSGAQLRLEQMRSINGGNDIKHADDECGG